MKLNSNKYIPCLHRNYKTYVMNFIWFTVEKEIICVFSCILQSTLQKIKFPTTMEEVTKAQVDFLQISRFPQVIGAVDGTHIRLNGAPLGPAEHVYVNRKGYHSINTQIICGADYKIINLVARWPGSTHDSRILQVLLISIGSYIPSIINISNEFPFQCKCLIYTFLTCLKSTE